MPSTAVRSSESWPILHAIAEAIAIAVIASLLTAFFIRAIGVPSEIDEHDSRVAVLNRDLRRWLRDRNRDLEIELRRITNTKAASGQLYAGGLPAELALAKRLALQQWRDEATRAMDEFDAIGAREGRLHMAVRGRRRHTVPDEPPRLEFPPDGGDVLTEWRADVSSKAQGGGSRPVVDPTGESLEPELRAFEEAGYRAWPARSLLTGATKKRPLPPAP